MPGLQACEVDKSEPMGPLGVGLVVDQPRKAQEAGRGGGKASETF